MYVHQFALSTVAVGVILMAAVYKITFIVPLKANVDTQSPYDKHCPFW